MDCVLLIRYGPGTGTIVRRLPVLGFVGLQQWIQDFNALASQKKQPLMAEIDEQQSSVVNLPAPQQVLEEIIRSQS